MMSGFTTNKATHVVNFRKRLSALEMQGSLLSRMMGPAHQDVAFSHDSLVKNQVLLLQLVRSRCARGRRPKVGMHYTNNSADEPIGGNIGSFAEFSKSSRVAWYSAITLYTFGSMCALISAILTSGVRGVYVPSSGVRNDNVEVLDSVFLLQRGNGHLRVLLDACVELHDHEPAVETYEQLLQCMCGRVCWVLHCGNDGL
jgi:hypothetical protein